jgi:tetratricopeptide (TPR) repeat protein
MSPEQADGRLDLLGPASDVYSLGATLYTLLTGRAPFVGRDVERILGRVERGDFPSPRQVSRDVPPALEAICLKAMKLRPCDRYPSARALADDLKHWLADEPAEAYPDPVLSRLARWARRHKPAVAGAGALVASAMVGLAIGNVLLGRARAQVLAAKKQADHNFLVARGVVEQLLTRVVKKDLASVPQMEPLRLELAGNALRIHEEFLRQRPEDPKVRYDAARVYKEAAHVFRLNNQFDRSLKYYLLAVGLLDRLIAEDKGSDAYRDLMAETKFSAGEVLRHLQRFKEAEPYWVASLEITRALRAQSPNDPAFRRTESAGLLDLSHLQYEIGRYPESRQSCRRAIELLSPLADGSGSTPVDRIVMVMLGYRLGAALREEGNPKGSEEALVGAVRRSRALVRDFPKDNNSQYVLSVALVESGRLLAADPGRRGEAGQAYDESVARLTSLAKDYPTLAFYRKMLARALDEQGCVLADARRVDRAGEALDRAKSLLEELVRTSPDVLDYQSQLGRTLGDMGRLAIDRGDLAAAGVLLNQALGLQERVLGVSPDSFEAAKLRDRHKADLSRATGP